MKKFFFNFILITLSFVMLFIRVYALEDRKEIKLYLGMVEVLSVSSPRRIVISNPNIADVTDVTKNTITLSPKAVGTTTLVLWDNFGEQPYQVKVFAENIAEVKRRIDNLLAKLNLPQVYTQAEEEEGKVLLLGTVKTPQDKEKISTVWGALKDKTVDLIVVKEEETTVEIDVQVLELGKDATDTLGFTNPLSTTSGYSITEVNSPSLAAAGWKDLFAIKEFKRGTAFSWTLFALIQEGKARLLSRPRLACQSGKEAELLVGGEKPTFTTSTTTVGTSSTVAYKEFGIKLKIKPTVTEDKRIKLALNVEVSTVGEAVTIGGTTTTGLAYPLTKRSASTELYLDDGQIMVIGGLIKEKKEEDITKTPFLGDIPILGLFFRKKVSKIGGGQGERGDSELFITLTPTIIKEGGKKEEAKPEIRRPIRGRIAKESPVSGYVRELSHQIRRNFVYPWAAQEANLEGSLRLALCVYYTGQLLDVEIRESSGYVVLDENAVNTVKKAAPYSPFPPKMKQKKLWIDLPVVYKIK
jgi:pilus assembly protein CpaC